MRWQYRFTPDSFPPRALDDHVRIGGEHFDLIDTEYSLQPRPDGTTTLRVAISYRVSTRFNWYARPLAELFVGNFEKEEETALRFYARRCKPKRRASAQQDARPPSVAASPGNGGLGVWILGNVRRRIRRAFVQRRTFA